MIQPSTTTTFLGVKNMIIGMRLVESHDVLGGGVGQIPSPAQLKFL